jgi:hypothetical protein
VEDAADGTAPGDADPLWCLQDHHGLRPRRVRRLVVVCELDVNDVELRAAKWSGVACV